MRTLIKSENALVSGGTLAGRAELVKLVTTSFDNAKDQKQYLRELGNMFGSDFFGGEANLEKLINGVTLGVFAAKIANAIYQDTTLITSIGSEE